MSDIHYDPYFGTPKAFATPTTTTCANATVAQYGCDSPWSLIQSAMLDVASRNPSFVIVTGDYTRHAMDQVSDSESDAQLPIIRNVTMELQANLSPGTTILPVLGNNDVLPDYYLDVVAMDRNSSQLKWLGDTLLDLQVISEDEATLFRYGGFYARTIGQIRIVCLNTVVYSVYHTPKVPDFNSDPYGQFTWLQRELESNENVYIVGHIPPTISSYAHDDMWDERYRLLYEQIVQMHASSIRAQLFGHFHDIEFRVLATTNLSMFLGPALTPAYNNNPAYQVIHYQTSNGQLEDMDSYILNLSDPSATGWSKLSSMREEYGLEDLSPSSIQKDIIDLIHDQDTLVLTKFLFNYKCGVYSHSMQTCLESGVDSCSMDWYCTMTCNSSAAFTACRYGVRQDGSHLSDATKIVLVLVGFAALGCFLYLYLPCCRRRAHDYDVPDAVHVEEVPVSTTAEKSHEVNENEIF